jgi:hypothetical protein
MNRATRKKLLVTQGALHRAEIVMAKQVAQENLRPGAIGRKLPQFALFALTALGGRHGAGLPGMKLPSSLPVLAAGIAALAKGKSSFKPVIRSIVIAGAFAGVAALITKSKPQPAPDAATSPEPRLE